MKRVDTPALAVVSLFILAMLIGQAAMAAPPDDYYAQRDAGYGLVRQSDSDDGSGKLRYPIALARTDREQLLVACRRTGSLMLVDPAATQKDASPVVLEQQVGRQLSAMIPLEYPAESATSPSDLFLVTDEQAHELLMVRVTGESIDVVQRVAVAPFPVGITMDRQSGMVYVSSLWSRRLTVLGCVSADTDGSDLTPRLEHRQTLDVPLAPRTMRLVADSDRLIVADSFAGRLAIFETDPLQLKFEREFPGHNIRGLTVTRDGKTLLVAHQMLNELAHTVRNDVHWGLLMSNDLRWLKLDQVLTRDGDLYKGAHMHPLGEAGSATGDPTSLYLTSGGYVLVTLGGVGEVAIGREEDFSLRRVRVGKRPVAIAESRNGDIAYIANCFDDSISILDIASRRVTETILLGDQRPLSLVEKGERLFYDATLSHDSWMSCNSCHTDGHTNGLTNDNFSDKSFGAPKRVLSLLGRHGTEPFAWNGEAKDLQSQIEKSIVQTMQGDREPTQSQLDALAAFVDSLAPPPSVAALRGVADTASIERGRHVFLNQKCDRCHQPPTYTSPQTYDVGLQDKFKNRLFNPPSLRGVGQRGSFFHDNRAETLEDVFRLHGHPQAEDSDATGVSPSDLEDEQLPDLLNFLRSL